MTVIDDYREFKEYVRLALAERARYQADPPRYNPQQAPNELRDAARVSLENVQRGINATLFDNIETAQKMAAYRVCQVFGAPKDAPVIEFADGLLAEEFKP